ncbi:arginase [Aureicoccus marinus]|uniref:Arginase n=1 Tax=Aureicoccus marinus TaxID=754435 RepID=A0A2S7TAR6_9FLAO|nr:arginase [Aureicoccus marinus]PQJ16618.1 arginase [Aureicoccus marinus]
MTSIQIIKNRSDIGAGTRGSDMGIDAIEIAAINAGNDYFNRYFYLDVPTHNESVYNKVKVESAKRVQFVLSQCQRVSKSVRQVLGGKHFPIVLSGDHSSALGTLSGLKGHFPQKNIGVIWIDAHADLHSPYSTPSGNVHGMPLAAALGADNLKYQVNDLDEQARSIWEEMKDIEVEGPKVKPEHLIYFGLRDTEEAEDALREELGIRNYTVAETRFRGLENCLSEALGALSSCDYIYVSFDVDSMDCDLISRGTGTPVSKGFDPEEVKTIIKAVIDTNKLICLEVCEVNPLLDTKGNVMAETAFKVLDSVTAHFLEHHG